jgi:hypothetical protein
MIAFTEEAGGRETTATTLADLDKHCAEYEGQAAKLEEMIHALETDLEKVRNQHLAGLKRQAGVVANREATLHNAIEGAPELFTKPRTMLLHGVKIGYATSQGKVEFDDAEQVVLRIRKHLRARMDELIRTKEEPNKQTLRTLSAVDLAKVGCTIEGAGDVVVLERTAGDVEKLVNKLIEKMVAAMVAG